MSTYAWPFLLALAGCPGGTGVDSEPASDSDSGDTGDTGGSATDSESDTGSDTETDSGVDSDSDSAEAGPFVGLDTGIDGVASAKFVGTEDHLTEVELMVASCSDLDGDGSDDLAMVAGVGLLIFPGGTLGMHTFDDAPVVRTGGVGAVAGAGDVNGDGVPDVLVGAPYFDVDGGAYDTIEGKAYVLLGPIEGTEDLESSSVAGFLGPDDNEPESSGDGWSYAGAAIAGAGDVDDDGYDDILIGAPGADDGYAWLFYGPVSGEHDLSDGGDVQFRGVFVSPELSWSGLGGGLVGVGDSDGDGFDDVLIGGGSGALLFNGPLSGELTYADADASLFDSSGEATTASDHLSSAGDLDGDGYPDLALGWPHYGGMPDPDGLVFVMHGPFSGEHDLLAADATLYGEADDFAGYGLACAGDMDQDGRDDLLVGAPEHVRAGYGRAYLLRGDLRGTSNLGDADVILRGSSEDHMVGWSVAGAGDVDGDSLPDLLVTGPGDDELVENGGAVWLVPGSVFR